MFLFKLHPITFFDCFSKENHNLLVFVNAVLVRLRKEVLQTTFWLWKESLYGHRKTIFTIEDIEIFYSDFRYLNIIDTCLYKNFTGYGVNV